MPDCLIIGGGIIGLSLAYELAGSGRSVQLIERGKVGQEASWAGAGILPPPATSLDVPPWRRLQAESFELHRQWSARLLEETGIDNGFRKCGAIHLARRPGEAAVLRADMLELSEDGVRVDELKATSEIASMEPQLRMCDTEPVLAAYHLPDEAQIRNPRQLQALASGCRQRGVSIIEDTPVRSLQVEAGRLMGVTTEKKEHSSDTVVLASGAWSETLVNQLGLQLSVYPVRGQMVLYRCETPPLTCIINEGPRYIVPRDDGRVLVGSTEEDVGFDKRTTEEGLFQLQNFAQQLLPPVASAKIEQTWAGLRPHGVDGFPYIGRVPHLKNAFVAAGHYRAGLATSTGTAVLLRQMIDGEPLAYDVSDFRLDR